MINKSTMRDVSRIIRNNFFYSISVPSIIKKNKKIIKNIQLDVINIIYIYCTHYIREKTKNNHEDNKY